MDSRGRQLGSTVKIFSTARGCSTEACDFRDHLAQLRLAGAARVFSMSSQSTDTRPRSCNGCTCRSR